MRSAKCDLRDEQQREKREESRERREQREERRDKREEVRQEAARDPQTRPQEVLNNSNSTDRVCWEKVRPQGGKREESRAQSKDRREKREERRDHMAAS